MKRLLPLGTTLLLVLASVALLTADKKNDPSALIQADIAFAKTTADRGVDGFLTFLAEDISTLVPNSPIITGKKAFADLWAPMIADPRVAIRWAPSAAAISSSGDFGYTIGSFEGSRTDERGKQVFGTGKYVTIWKKQRDVGWKVVFTASVPDRRPPATQQP